MKNIFIISLMLLGSLSLSVFSQFKYNIVNPLPVAQFFYDDGTLYGFGENRLTTSEDGIRWQSAGLRKFRFPDDKFNQILNTDKGFTVCFSDRTSTIGIFSTSLAFDWPDYWHSTFLGRVVLSVAYGNNTFIASGENGLLLTSTDDKTWTTVTTDELSGSLSPVIFADSQFVLLTSGGTSNNTKVWTSQNGQLWNEKGTMPRVDFEYIMVYGNSTFMAIPRYAIDSCYISSNLETWTAQSTGSGRNRSAAEFVDGEFRVYDINGGIMSSPDGFHWTQTAQMPRRVHQIVPIKNGYIAVCSDSANYCPILKSSSISGPWVPVRSYMPSKNLSSVSYGNGRYVAVGDEITFSTDGGNTWESSPISFSTSATSPRLKSITYGANLFVIVGARSTIASSPDGKVWTGNSQTLGLLNLCSVIYADGKFVAVGDSAILTSIDGITWTIAKTQLNINLSSVAYGNGEFNAVGDFYGYIRSKDGISWEKVDDLKIPFGSHIDKKLIFAGGKYVMRIGSDGPYSSTDLTTWTSGSLSPNSSKESDMTFGFGKFIYAGDYSQIITSDDAVSWVMDTTLSPTNYSLRGIACGENEFVAVGDSGTIIVSTPDSLKIQISSKRAVSEKNLSRKLKTGRSCIYVPMLSGIKKIMVQSLSGRVLFKPIVYKTGTELKIPTTNLPPGVYMIMIDYINGTSYSASFATGL